jgi:hypothetical protein
MSALCRDENFIKLVWRCKRPEKFVVATDLYISFSERECNERTREEKNPAFRGRGCDIYFLLMIHRSTFTVPWMALLRPGH